MVWTCHEEIPRICRKKDDGNEVTGKEEKRETKEKIFRYSERRYGKSWCKGNGRWKQDGLETDNTLWLPLIEEKGRKKKKKFELLFAWQYETIRRLETNKLRNVAKVLFIWSFLFSFYFDDLFINTSLHIPYSLPELSFYLFYEVTKTDCVRFVTL